MKSQTEKIILTEAQAACLKVLKRGIGTKMKIALAAKIDMAKTSDYLEELKALNLVKQDNQSHWNTTRRGRSCSFGIIPDGASRKRRKLSLEAQCILKALDQPIRINKLAKCLRMSRKSVSRIAIMLHARGLIRYCDREHILGIIARSDDPTFLLTQDEELLLSVFSDEYATSASKIKSTKQIKSVNRITEKIVNIILARLVSFGLIDELRGLGGATLYAITKAGLTHPQYDHAAQRAEPPRLPVTSDRVIAVLSNISDTGPVKIKDASQMLEIPYQSANSLFQYLKRKSFIRKIRQQDSACYTLTDEGRKTVAEVIQRRAA